MKTTLTKSLSPALSSVDYSIRYWIWRLNKNKNWLIVVLVVTNAKKKPCAILLQPIAIVLYAVSSFRWIIYYSIIDSFRICSRVIIIIIIIKDLIPSKNQRLIN